MTDADMTQEDIQAVRADILAIQDETKWSNAAIASDSGTANSTFSQFMSDKYQGNTAAVAKSLKIWVHSHRESREVLDKIGSLSGYVETPTGRKIKSVLKYCRAARDMGAIVGVPGMSKTATARHYSETHARVVHVEMSPSSSKATSMLRLISQEMKLHASHRVDFMRRSIEEYLSRSGLLIIDEAQHLDGKALEELRSIHDRSRCGLVLMGNHTVVTRLSGAGRDALFAQINSRMGMRLTVPDTALKHDINALLKANNITHEPSINALTKIAQQHGALRRMMKVVKLAQMLSTEKATPAEIHEAILTANAQLSGRGSKL